MKRSGTVTTKYIKSLACAAILTNENEWSLPSSLNFKHAEEVVRRSERTHRPAPGRQASAFRLVGQLQAKDPFKQSLHDGSKYLRSSHRIHRQQSLPIQRKRNFDNIIRLCSLLALTAKTHDQLGVGVGGSQGDVETWQAMGVNLSIDEGLSNKEEIKNSFKTSE